MNHQTKMSGGQLTIAMKLEGMPEDNGNIRLDDFLHQLEALKSALNSVDREISGGKTTLYYRVVDLTHSSPATVIVEPVLKQTHRMAALRGKFRNNPELVHHRFFSELDSIRSGAEKQEGTREETVEAFVDLMEGFQTRFNTGAIFNAKTAVQLDGQLQESLHKLIKPEFQSLGSVEGDLLAINVAHGHKFYIYPAVGPTSIACNFSREKMNQATANIEKRVRVYGTKYFRAKTDFPFRVEVERIEPIVTPKKWVTFATRRKKFVGEPAHVTIGRMRNEWS